MSLCTGAHGRQKQASDPMEFEAVVNDLKSTLRTELWSLAMAACAHNHWATSPALVCGFSTAATVSSPGTGGRWGGRGTRRTCSLARLVKTMFNHLQVYITCPALGKILEMQACNNTVVVTMLFTSTVLQRPSQMPQAILLPIFKDRQFLSTQPPFFCFVFLR